MRLSKLIAAIVLLCAFASAQNAVTASQVNIPLTPILTPITSANLSVVGGSPGNATYYYWIVTQFLLGPSQPVLMGVVNNAPNTLGASNYVAIVPQFTAAALTADVLRTTSPIAPTGTCNCAVTTGATSSSTIKDTSNSLGGYTVLAAVSPASYQMSLTNQVEAAGITHLILQQGNTTVADLSIASTTYFPGVPSGNCINTSTTAELAINQSNGNVYYCNATPGNIGTWAQIASAVGSAAFSAITGGVNTAALLIGTGGSLGTTGSGTIQATSNTGNSATATALASVPTQCSGSNFAQGIAANGNGNCAQPGISGLAPGTTTLGAYNIGTGSSLQPTGSGTIVANQATGTQIAQTGVDINTSFQVTSLHLSAPLGVGMGGLGIASGTSGGILGFTGTNTIASSSLLAIGAMIAGGGSGALPTSSTMVGLDTTKLPGATWDARLNYCLNTVGAPICNMHAETAGLSSTTAITVPSAVIILPHVHLTYGNTFTLNFTSPNYALLCIENDNQCILDASNNGSAGIVNASASNGYFQGWGGIGGRLNGQTGSEFVASNNSTPISNVIVDHVQIAQAGANAFGINNCSYCGFRNRSEADSPFGVGFNVNATGAVTEGDFVLDYIVKDANEGSIAGNGDVNIQSSGGDFLRHVRVGGGRVSNGEQYGGSGIATFTNGSNAVTLVSGINFTTGTIWVGWHLVAMVGKVPYDYMITGVSSTSNLTITQVGTVNGFQQASGNYAFEVYAPAAWPIIAESQGYATSSASTVTWASHSGTDLQFVYDTATFTGTATGGGGAGSTVYFTCTSSCNVLPGVYTVSGNGNASLNGSCTVPYASHGTFVACTYSGATTVTGATGGTIAGSPWNNGLWSITFNGGGTFPITAVTSATTLTVTGTPGIGAATVFTVTPTTPSIYDTGASEGIQVLDKQTYVDIFDNDLFNIGSEGIVCGAGNCVVHHNSMRNIGMTTSGTGCALQSIQTPQTGGQANITISGSIIDGNLCVNDSSFGVPNGGVQQPVANQNGVTGYGIWSHVGAPTTGSLNVIEDQNYSGNNFSVVGYGSMVYGFEYTNSATGTATVTLQNDLLCGNTFSTAIQQPFAISYDAYTIGTWQICPTNLVGGYPTAGVGVDLSNPTTLPASDRASFIPNAGSGATSLTLPAATGAFANGFPFLLQNNNSPTGNISVTPTTPNNIDSGTSQAPAVVIPNWAAFFYQDNANPINWHSVKFPTFSAFGSTCTNGLTWSTTTGFSCLSGAPALLNASNTYTGTNTQTFVAGSVSQTSLNFGSQGITSGFIQDGAGGYSWVASGGAKNSLTATLDNYGNGVEIGFSSAASSLTAPDVGFGRASAGVISVDGTTALDGKGKLQSAGLQSTGTTFTASGCSNSTLVGGASSGSYNSGTTGTCTVTITFGNSLTAAHGWSCWANDLTTTADTIKQTGGSTTTAILSGTTASGDVINFGCLAY